jgi:hypothetical protein
MRVRVNKGVLLVLGLAIVMMSYAGEDFTKTEMQKAFEFFVQEKSRLDIDTKRVMVNELIRGGILTGVMFNGNVSSYRDGILAEYSEAFIKNEFLACGDTVTASPRMLSKDRCIGGVLNCDNMQLVTLRDWQKQDWFGEVKVLTLSHNQFTEVPVPFFELFSNLKKVVFSGTPIMHLDTKYMPHGLKVIADYTKLASVSSYTLDTDGYYFDVRYTNLATDVLTLAAYRSMCVKQPKNWVMKLLERCLCKNPESEDACISSVFIS